MISLHRKSPKPRPRPRPDDNGHLELDRNGDAWFIRTIDGTTTRTRLVPADEEDS